MKPLFISELQKKTSLEVLDLFVQTAEEFEFFILFDLHSFEANSFKQNGLWYDEEHPETTVLQGWDVLIQRYSNAKSVFAVDLKNEPFSATWGTENLQTDWNRAAERIGSYIVERTNWLIFIEGTGATPRCAEPCFWGENLQGVETTPVRLSQPNRLVYSPHCYGPDVHNQNYFSHDNFPQNMPRIWDRHFGFIRGKNESAVVVGEWGGSTDGKNGVWFREFADYLIKKDMTDTFFWCLNPNSYDTGGLLEKDWTTPVQSKLDILSTLVPLPS